MKNRLTYDDLFSDTRFKGQKSATEYIRDKKRAHTACDLANHPMQFVSEDYMSCHCNERITFFV